MKKEKEDQVKRYRILISTKGRIGDREDKNGYANKSYWNWVISPSVEQTKQGNQINYFIPISEQL